MRRSSAPPVAALSARNISQATDPAHLEQRLVDLVQVQPRLAARKGKVFHDHHAQRAHLSGLTVSSDAYTNNSNFSSKVFAGLERLERSDV
jgi:hypothetical protein